MCVYIISYHVYSGCRLQEITANGQPSREVGLLGRLYSLWLGSGEANDDNDQNPDGREHGGEEDPSEVPEFHRVRIKSIFQCGEARGDLDLQDTPEDRRICANPTYAYGDYDQVQNVGLTTQRGECPVCTAIMDVIRQETHREHVVSDLTMKPSAKS